MWYDQRKKANLKNLPTQYLRNACRSKRFPVPNPLMSIIEEVILGNVSYPKWLPKARLPELTDIPKYGIKKRKSYIKITVSKAEAGAHSIFWCVNNCEGRFEVYSIRAGEENVFLFDSRRDAAMFRLMFEKVRVEEIPDVDG